MIVIPTPLSVLVSIQKLLPVFLEKKKNIPLTYLLYPFPIPGSIAPPHLPSTRDSLFRNIFLITYLITSMPRKNFPKNTERYILYRLREQGNAHFPLGSVALWRLREFLGVWKLGIRNSVLV